MDAEPVVHVVLLGDVGNSSYHLGDEALAQVAVEQLRRHGPVRFTVVTPDALSPFVSYAADTVAPPAFESAAGPAEDSLRDVALAGIEDTALAAAVRSADAVLVAGGGNLCASWPHLLAQRVAALRLARAAGKPAVLTGQTIGPELTPRQRALLSEVLPTAVFVGCRDMASLSLVGQLAPTARAVLQLDDAVAVVAGLAPQRAALLPEHYVVLAIHDHERIAETAATADHLAFAAGLPVVVMPSTDADIAVADEVVAAALSPRVMAGPLLSPDQFADAVRHAHVVVSSRFHPLVFALAGHVPCLALSSDHYTATKLEGALAHAGMQGWRLPSAALGSRAAGALIDELLQRRAEISDHLAMVSRSWFAWTQQHWADVWAALCGRPFERQTVQMPEVGPLPRVVDVLALQRVEAAGHTRAHLAIEQANTAVEYAGSLRDAREVDLQELAKAREYAASLSEVLAARDAEIAGLKVVKSVADG